MLALTLTLTLTLGLVGAIDAAPPALEAASSPIAPVTVPVFVGGEVAGAVAVAAARGLTVLDLSNAWTPRFLAEDPALGEAGRVPFRATYLGLADEQPDVAGAGPRAGGDRYLEQWAVWPSRRVLQARLQDDERHACHAAVVEADSDVVDNGGSGVIAALPVPLSSETRGLSVRRDADIARLRARVLAGKAGDADRERLARLQTLRRGIFALQAHLVCDGLLAEAHVDGGFGPATARALAIWQRREALPVREGVLDDDSRARLARCSIERDWLALLRGLRERVADAVGLLEDGSAGGGPGLVVGELLDPAIVRAPLRSTPAIAGAADVIAATTEAAVRALGLQDKTTAGAVLAGLPDGRVALALPPPPPWHGPHMDLVVTLERGDVDDRGILARGAARRPMLTISTRHQGAVITLARLPTTIGGEQREKLPDNRIIVKKKASPTGAFVWRSLWSQPAW